MRCYVFIIACCDLEFGYKKLHTLMILCFITFNKVCLQGEIVTTQVLKRSKEKLVQVTNDFLVLGKYQVAISLSTLIVKSPMAYKIEGL